MAPSPPDVASIVADIDARLAELAPLIEEHAKLTAARVELTRDGIAPARPARRTAAGSARAARRRAPRGANRGAILAYVAENPGATIAQIAEATGIAKPTLYTTVSGLKKRGELIASGRGVKAPQADAPTRSRARRARSRRRASRRAAAGARAARRPAAPPAPDASDAAAPTGTTDAHGTPSA